MKDEIKIVHVNLETPLVLCENTPQLLIVENPEEFYRVVSDFDAQMEGGEGEFVFSCQGDVVLPIKHGHMLRDLICFDLNDKKTLNLLYKHLEKDALGKDLQYYNNLNAVLVTFLEELGSAVPFALSFDEPQPSDYFKSACLRFEKTYESLEEKIICHINALIELKNCDFFIFVNLKSVLSDEKLMLVYDHCQKEKVGLLLIESSKIRKLLPCEKAVIITHDLCEILENYDDS